MRKFLNMLALLLLAVSCEIPFDLDQAGEARIYVQAIVKRGHVHIVPMVAQAVNGEPVPVSSIQVQAELNGVPLKVEKGDSIWYSASSACCFVME